MVDYKHRECHSLNILLSAERKIKPIKSPLKPASWTLLFALVDEMLHIHMHIYIYTSTDFDTDDFFSVTPAFLTQPVAHFGVGRTWVRGAAE